MAVLSDEHSLVLHNMAVIEHHYVVRKMRRLP